MDVQLPSGALFALGDADETNGADPERVYCGVRLVGRLSSMMSGDRPLPPQFKCGVCQTANDAEEIRCSSCSAARVAPRDVALVEHVVPAPQEQK